MNIKLTNQANWMSAIDDNYFLSQLSIPGTHQTMTYEASNNNWMKTQTKTIEEQFEMGIRFFDIRLTYLDTVGHEGNLVLTQANSYLKSFFSDVLIACQNLLIKHPTETILISIKREHEILSDKFIHLFKKYINQNKEFWYLGKTIPQLKLARGKIVLIKRFKETDYGIDLSVWESNSHFSHTNQNLVSYDIQDKYKGFDRGSEEKKYDDNVYPQLIRAFDDSDINKLYLNFANGMEPIWPSTLSGVTNPKIFNYLKSAQIGRYGIISLDYPENVKFLPISIIKTNHFKTIENNKIYTISPKHISHLNLDAIVSNNKYGVELVINRLDDDIKNQTQAWKLLKTDDGYFYLASLVKEPQVLTVIKKDNQELCLTLWENKQKDNQKWKFNLFKEGFYTISPKVYPHLMLDVKDKKIMPNSSVILSNYIANTTDHKMFSQRWVLMLIALF
jgi:hypothetical protein